MVIQTEGNRVMADKRYRSSLSGVKVQEKSAWGVNTAVERYGKSEHLHGAPQPKDTHGPQFAENKHGPGYDNDTKGWVRAAGETAENRPNYGRSRPRER
jgi:hypothetical protein